MGQAVTRIAISKRKRRAFLNVLATTGSVTQAAQAVGYTDTSYVNRLRRQDEAFAEEWALAADAAGDALEDEADRRGRDGIKEPVFYKGAIVGYKNVYSDALLMFRLRGLRPEKYRENSRGGDTNINFGIAVLPMTAKNDQEWENRAIEMHKGQEVITIPDKPVENNLLTVRRGD